MAKGLTMSDIADDFVEMVGWFPRNMSSLITQDAVISARYMQASLYRFVEEFDEDPHGVVVWIAPTLRYISDLSFQNIGEIDKDCSKLSVKNVLILPKRFRVGRSETEFVLCGERVAARILPWGQ